MRNGQTPGKLHALPTRRGRFILAIAAAVPSVATTYTTLASEWSGANNTASWSSNSNPGWNGTGVPNAIGAVANSVNTSNATALQDTGATVTVGQLGKISSQNSTWTVSLTNAISLNQGATGNATILNSNTNTSNPAIILSGAGGVSFDDDVDIKNTGNSTRATGSIVLSTNLSGGSSGNLRTITIENNSNNVASGQIIISPPGTNTFYGNTTIKKGAVTFNKASAFGQSTNSVTLGFSGLAGATLIQTTAVNMPNALTIASGSTGTLLLGSSSIDAGTNSTYSGGITLNGTLSTTSAQNGTTALLFSGTISGAGGLNANATGAGNTRLTGTNIFDGETRILANALQLGAASGNDTQALQFSTLNLATGDTGLLRFGTSTSTTITSATIGGLKGTRDLDLRNMATSPAAVALSVGKNDDDTTYGGALTGTGSLTKIGTGSLTLTGTSTYSGATAVNDGSLLINGAYTGGGTVTVGNGSGVDLLGGTGSITAAVNLASNGVLSPGASIESLNVTGNVNLGTGKLLIELDESDPNVIDLLAVSGSLSLSSATVEFDITGELTEEAYVFATYGVALPPNTDFASALNVPEGYEVQTNYNGNQVALVAIPEPGTLGLVGLASLAFMQRRSRRARVQ